MKTAVLHTMAFLASVKLQLVKLVSTCFSMLFNQEHVSSRFCYMYDL